MRIFFASQNAHKLAEIRAMLATSCIEVEVCLPPLGMPNVDENATDFAGNAHLKCAAILPQCAPTDWVLADDSGLVVDALDGAPGVHSSRYAGAAATDADNNAKLLNALTGLPLDQRRARFVCHLALQNPKGEHADFRGTCEGHIAERCSGMGGFGYDPLFIPKGQTQSLATLGADFKNCISHRAAALRQLAAFLQDRLHLTP